MFNLRFFIKKIEIRRNSLQFFNFNFINKNNYKKILAQNV
jgi:hypothetical protein